jgi:hypothetical protein
MWVPLDGRKTVVTLRNFGELKKLFVRKIKGMLFVVGSISDAVVRGLVGTEFTRVSCIFFLQTATTIDVPAEESVARTDNFLPARTFKFPHYVTIIITQGGLIQDSQSPEGLILQIPEVVRHLASPVLVARDTELPCTW